MAMDDSGSNSASSPLSSVPSYIESDSELSMLSTSPSPPPELRLRDELRYPSPSLSSSSSQRSSRKASPAPGVMTSTPPSGDDDGRPRKRRKTDPKERTTARLDLRSTHVPDEQKPQLARLLKVLHNKRKIVVIAGAGISVSAGIPDFRSAGGLFNSLRKQHKLKSSGKDLFDASVYQDDTSTSTFHDMIRSLSLSTKEAQPTPFHHLLATLAQEGRLLRLYTQNVDGIDTSLPPLKTQVPLPKKAPWPKTVQLHGGLDFMVCSKCHNLADFDAGQFNGPVPPECPRCAENDAVRAVADKRSHGIGCLRPRMVLYNEHNPDDEAIGSCASLDLRTRPDAVIVAGTTLKVPGVRRIAREMCAVVRDRRDGVAIWINNDPEPLGKDLANSWDIIVQGPCDEVARHAAMRNWDDPMEFKEVTDDQLRQAKDQQKAAVLVSSPKKASVLQVQGQMLTPAQSPRIGAVAQPSTVEEKEPSTPTKTIPKKRKSQTATLDSMFKATKNAAATAKPKKPRQKKKTNTKKTEGNSNQMITDNFASAKSSVRPGTKPVGAKYSSPLITLPDQEKNTIEVMPSTPNVSVANLLVKSEDTVDVVPRTHASLQSVPVLVPKKSSRAQVTKFKNNNASRSYMADLPPSDFRINATPIGTPERPKMEPFSPHRAPSTPEFEATSDSRPSSAGSRISEMINEVIVPDKAPRSLFGVLNMFKR